MKRQSMVLLAAGIMALGAPACFKDPVESLQGSPSRVSVSRRILQQNVGDTDVVNIQVLDAQGNPLVLSGVTLASLDPTVADVAPLPPVNGDSSLRSFPGNTLTKIIVFSKAPGRTQIAITANGVNDTLTVTSYPTAFQGTITPATAKTGDTITITAPALVTFGPTATATVTGAKNSPLLQFISRSATTLKYIAGGAIAGAKATISGGVLLGTINLPDLTSTATFTIGAEAAEAAGNNAPGGGSKLLTVPTVVGDSVVAYGTLNGTDIDDYFGIVTVAGDSIEMKIVWPVGAPTDLDIDGLFFRNNGTTLVKCPCTGANPEDAKARIGFTETYWLEVNMYDTHGHSETWPYRVILWRR